MNTLISKFSTWNSVLYCFAIINVILISESVNCENKFIKFVFKKIKMTYALLSKLKNIKFCHKNSN